MNLIINTLMLFLHLELENFAYKFIMSQIGLAQLEFISDRL